MDSRAGTAPDELTTVVFTDVERSTELATGRGDEVARRLLRDHEETVRAQLAEHGGREMKALGDGFMLAFGSPRRAIACAVDIQRALDRAAAGRSGDGLRVRIGINIGEVLHEEGDMFGEAVNAAARIAAKAEGGEVLVSDVVRQLVGTVPGVGFADRGRFRLKGFPDRWRLHRVVWEDDSAAAPAELPTRTPMVGRDREREELSAAMARAIEGRGGVVMIGGEPGIGKTRLCEELARDVRRRGLPALLGRCYDSEAVLPYQPFTEIVQSAIVAVPREALRSALGDAGGDVATIVPELHRAFDDLPPALQLPAEQERRHLFTAMRGFVERAAAQAPLLLILDDLHWADASTLLLLEHLAERAAAIPALIVGTYRDVELETTRPFAASLDSLIRRRLATRMTLRRLPPDATAAVLAGLSGSQPPQRVVDAIVAETEGNPFFVEEVFRHFAEEGRLLDAEGRWRQDRVAIEELEVPQSVRLVIGRRLDRLSETARKVLAGAAVIGRTFEYTLLEEVTADVGADALLDAIDEAERAALVSSFHSGRAATFQFAHELIRQTLLGTLSAPRRQRLHLRVADALEARAGSDAPDSAADIAHHLYESGAAADTERTVRWLLRAARRDIDAAAHEDALRLVDHALELADSIDDRTRASLLDVRGRALRSTGHWTEAMDCWTQALDLLEQARDYDAHMSLCNDLVIELNWAGRQLDAVLMCGRGLAMAEQAPRADPRATTMLAWSAAGFSFMGNYEVGSEQVRKALDGATGVADLTAQVDIEYALAYHHWFWLELDRCAELAENVVAMCRQGGLAWRLAESLGLAGLTHLYRGDVRRALACAAEASAAGVRLGHAGAEFTAGRTQLLAACMAGDLDKAQRLSAHDCELAQQTGFAWAFDADVLASVLDMWRGDWDAARVRLDRAAAAEIPCPFAESPWGYGALLDGLRGDRARVVATADATRSLIGRPGEPALIGLRCAVGCLAEALALVGEGTRAYDLYPHLLDSRSRSPMRGYDARLLDTVAGMVASSVGEWDAAEAHFDRALRLAGDLGNVRDAAETRRARGAMLIARGRAADRAQARALLEESAAQFRAMRAPGYAAAAEAMLRTL